ncbi:MAG: hypothetical protein ACD_51C00283G0008 [uncultured bacterium]|nr:MAG: hypothetical protein ACD_51C00283G0008 [uncultured bacterium]OGJ47958.1 MAG: hypothetical protein A2344_04230 [Candidatus Peregrinibacteria bacterium RIFOXYB12_FULL_41_12]OGJ48498.1 MAG: hypothetical protein A2244_05750 [Candidatus Peregrinibacteria bacterium RIFOXYA2_FULL_41_18]OGJ52739.1 MAG: hypothetical protein A2448_00970 [Candidatus Peregrinibacteria bacterium RIFOXYC2_FULL_41_22]OGJ54392.1 MAG: hypothetical protein A2336_03180 [Candidatus Peregrinibacteria bacterium RIFOXYB2_FULL
MKKIQIALLPIFILSLAGCGELSAIEYNNEIAQTLDSNSSLIKETITAYDSSIPEIVTEQTELDTVAMESALEKATEESEKIPSLLSLTSKSLEQETVVEEELAIYISASGKCLTVYSQMLNYYKSGDYKTDLESVSKYDTEIYENYNALIESNNKLADILEQYAE